MPVNSREKKNKKRLAKSSRGKIGPVGDDSLTHEKTGHTSPGYPAFMLFNPSLERPSSNTIGDSASVILKGQEVLPKD
jgi:hypothetical protein